MLVPIIGLGWALVVDAALIVTAFGLLLWFCRWLDAPRRELIDEIKRRPRIRVRMR